MKNYSILVLLTIFASSSGLLGQAGFGTLPLLRKDNSAALTGQNIKSGPAYEQALRVYNRLVEARGDRRYPVPALVMRKEEARVAQIFYDDLEIVLEQKAYEVCQSFGDHADAAIATLLGHELTHYYEKHAWRRSFSAEYRDLPVGIQLDSLRDDVTNETQADYLGGFLVYSAGFGMFDQGAELISRLYKAYGIPEAVSGYPSLQDRQTLSKRTTEKLQRLIEIFDMANLLTAVGKYEEALQYYKYVLQRYQSRELYNNVGVTAVLQALVFFSDNEMPYHLPLELDLESVGSRGSNDTEQLRRDLLQEAIHHFDAAISLDPDYAPAYLNKACAYLLLGDPDRAKFYAGVEALQVARSTKNGKTEVDVQVLLGIIAAQAKAPEQARSLFQQAAEQGSTLARINLDVLDGKTSPPIAATTPRGILEEKVGAATMTDVAFLPNYIDDQSVLIAPNLFFRQDPGIADDSPYPDARLYISDHTDEYIYSLFLQTKPGYTGTTALGIGIGASYADITANQAYGKPTKTIETTTGQLLVYPKVVFVMGPGDTLERWVLYTLDEGG